MNDELKDIIEEEYVDLMLGYNYLNGAFLVENEWEMKNGVFPKFSIYDESKYSSHSTTLSGLNSIK